MCVCVRYLVFVLRVLVDFTYLNIDLRNFYFDFFIVLVLALVLIPVLQYTHCTRTEVVFQYFTAKKKKKKKKPRGEKNDERFDY